MRMMVHETKPQCENQSQNLFIHDVNMSVDLDQTVLSMHWKNAHQVSGKFQTIIKQMQSDNAIQAVAPRRLSYPCLCEQAQNPTELRLWKDEEVQVRYIGLFPRCGTEFA